MACQLAFKGYDESSTKTNWAFPVVSHDYLYSDKKKKNDNTKLSPFEIAASSLFMATEQ